MGRLCLLLSFAPRLVAAEDPAPVGVIVHCDEPYAPLVARIEAMGGRVTRTYENVGAVAALIPSSALGELRADAGVDAIERDAEVHLPRPREALLAAHPFELEPERIAGADALAELGIDPSIHSSYLAAFTRAEEVWPQTGLGEGAVVAVIDSGTHADHVCLRGRVLSGPDLSTDAGTPFEGSTRASNFFHGTFVAGQVASECAIEIEQGSGFDAHLPDDAKIPVAPGVFRVPLLGIAPRAQIYAVKIFPHTGGSAANSLVDAAIDHVITLKRSGVRDVDAMNLSLGSVTLHDGRSLQERLVDEAVRAGIVVVVSAGNDGPSPATVSRPGTAFGAVTVGAATDPVHVRIFLDEFFGFVGAGAVLYPADELRVMEFSGQGPYADGRIGPDLVAPGLFSFGLFPSPPGPALVFASGTSFAAPQVAGAAALLSTWTKAHAPRLGAAQIRRALIDGAAPLGEEWSAQSQGNGLLDLPSSLARLQRRGRGPGLRGAPLEAPRRLEPNVALRAGRAFHERVTVERGRWVDWILEIDEATEAIAIGIEPVGGPIPPGPSGALGFPESFELFVKSAKRGGVEPDFVDGANVFDAARIEIRGGSVRLDGGISGNLAASPPAVLEPGLLKVTLESDWTNHTRFLSADVTIARVEEPERGRRRRPIATLSDSESRSFPIEIPVGAEQATFDLSWQRDWRSFPTDDLDLILLSPSGAPDFRGATLDSPERVVVDAPEAGVWTATVTGFLVHRGPSPYQLRVTLDGRDAPVGGRSNRRRPSRR